MDSAERPQPEALRTIEVASRKAGLQISKAGQIEEAEAESAEDEGADEASADDEAEQEKTGE